MSINISSNFLLSSQLPLDGRTVVADTTARDAIPTIQRYQGLIVYTTTTAKNYQLQGGILNTNWVDISSTSGAVTSVSGTTNRVTSTGGTTPVIDISATFEALLGKVANPLSQFAATTSAQLAGVITDETGTGALVFANTPTLTTAVLGSSTATTQTPADNSTKVATTAYVDNAVLGQRQKEAVKYASIAALPSIVYANGSSGVGATLTGVALAAISLDSSSPSVGDRVLIKNQVSTFQNGLYTVTATGSGIAVFVLTRTTDFDQSSDIQTGDTVFVTAGTTLANTTWTYNGIDSPTIGTTAITFAQAAGPGSYTAGNGIAITGTSIAIDTAVTVDKTTVQTLTNKTLTAPVLNSATTNISSGTVVFAGTAGLLSGDTTNFNWDPVHKQLRVGPTGGPFDLDSRVGVEVTGNVNDYHAAAVQNQNSGVGATGDFFVSADNDNSTLIGHYQDMGITSSGYNSVNAGNIRTVSVAAAGSGYSVGNILTIASGDGNATVSVATIGGGGTVTSVTITNNGTGYVTGSGYSTTGGGGTGCTINVLGIIDYTLWGANDGYLFTSGGNLVISTDTAGKFIKFSAEGVGTSNEVMQISAGNVAMATQAITTPNVSSLLDMQSTTKGALIPRMTSTQQNAIASPATGLLIFNTTTTTLNYFTGSVWTAVVTGAAPQSIIAGANLFNYYNFH